MAWVLYIFAAMAVPPLCAAQGPAYEGKSLSMSGFHLCTKNETRNVSVLVVHNVARKEEKPCGGWLMWMTCTVTLYQMVHQIEYREVEHQVTRCCDGYERVGRYCAPSVKRSDALAAKPGSCPRADGFIPTSEDSGRDCEWDIHCPDWQKCCPASNGSVCTDPHSVANAGRYRFNATVTVRTDYQQLLIKNGSLLNHTRILQAMVPGVLQADPLVYYLASWPVHPHRTATSLLIDSSSALSLHHVRSRLLLLLKHIQEVTSVSVDDVNECAHASLRHCSPHAECVNTVGSYQCTCTQGYLDADPVNTGVNCTAPAITSVQVANITGTSFCVYWSTESEDVQAFRITVHAGSEAVAAWDTNNTLVKVEELKPAVLYNVSVELSIHGNQVHTVHVVVKTEAQTVDATTRLTNIQFTDDLMNSSSEAFRNLSDSIKEEIYRAHELEALVNSGQLRIEIKNFSPGSVVVNFTIVLIPSDSQDIANTSKVVINSLTNSSKYAVDEDSTSVTDFDECASGDHDCSQKADCINSWASYTCVCQDGFTDINTQRPGRACQAALRTTLPTLSASSMANTVSHPSTTTRASAPATAAGATTLTFSTVTTNAPTFTVPFSLSDAPTSVSTALLRSTTPTFSASPLATVSSSTALTSHSTTSRSEDTSPTTAPPEQSSATTFQFVSHTSTSAAPMSTPVHLLPQSTTSVSTPTTPVPTSTAASSSAAPATLTTASVTPSTAPFTMTTSPTPTTTMSTSMVPTTQYGTATTLPTASSSPATGIISSSTATSTSAPTSVFTTPSSTRMNPSGAQFIQSTTTGTPTTAPTLRSTAPTAAAIASPTPSTAPSTPSTAPTAATIASPTPSTAPSTPSTAPSTPSTAPSTPSTAPTAATIASPTPSTAPSTPSTAPTAPTVASPTPSTAPSTPSTAPSTPSTAPTAATIASPTPSTAPSSPSTAPTVSTTAPTTLSTSHFIQTTTTLTTSPETITPSTTPKLSSPTPTPSTAATQTSTFTTPISLPLTSTALTAPPSLPTTMSQLTSEAPKSNTTKCQESLLESISVQCRVAAITVTIARDVLQQCRIMESSLYLGLEDCGVNSSNATHVQLTVAWNECATSLLHNDSAYTVTVTLLNKMKPYVSPTGTVEAIRMRLQVPIMCTYMRSMLMSADFSSVGYDMIKDVISSSGSFHVTVQLLNGTVPLPHNYTLTSDDVVVVEVSMNTSVEQIKVVIHSCWATTSPNPADAIRYTFLDNRCSLNSYTKVLMNGNSSTSSVSVQIFSFVNAKMIYLHCQVQICVQMGSDTCVPDCVQRTARLSNTIGTAFGSSGPLLNAGEDSAVDESDTLYVVGIACLGVILTLAFVIGSVCLFYCQRNRIGHYNFNVKPKEEKFSYLVFNT
ncbi:uromodulin-like 1 [Synchiropus splendidus]|uniref:uromodulin-like 1 n=1 Tax=Synchiropus splendidus TaxID=270530 RepID=UPI00237DF613|nr:uromodulin-like 1 [Synchiropus splendidus]